MNNNKPVKTIPVILDDLQKIKSSFRIYRDDFLKLDAAGQLMQTAADDAMSNLQYGTFSQIQTSLTQLVFLSENTANLITEIFGIFDLMNDRVVSLPNNYDEVRQALADYDAEKADAEKAN